MRVLLALAAAALAAAQSGTGGNQTYNQTLPSASASPVFRSSPATTGSAAASVAAKSLAPSASNSAAPRPRVNAFPPGSVLVSRVLSSPSGFANMTGPVVLDVITPAGVVFASGLPLSMGTTGMQCTLPMSPVRAGALSRSADGAFVSLTCLGMPAGYPAAAASMRAVHAIAATGIAATPFAAHTSFGIPTVSYTDGRFAWTAGIGKSPYMQPSCPLGTPPNCNEGLRGVAMDGNMTAPLSLAFNEIASLQALPFPDGRTYLVGTTQQTIVDPVTNTSFQGGLFACPPAPTGGLPRTQVDTTCYPLSTSGPANLRRMGGFAYVPAAGVGATASFIVAEDRRVPGAADVYVYMLVQDRATGQWTAQPTTSAYSVALMDGGATDVVYVPVPNATTGAGSRILVSSKSAIYALENGVATQLLRLPPMNVTTTGAPFWSEFRGMAVAPWDATLAGPSPVPVPSQPLPSPSQAVASPSAPAMSAASTPSAIPPSASAPAPSPSAPAPSASAPVPSASQPANVQSAAATSSPVQPLPSQEPTKLPPPPPSPSVAAPSPSGPAPLPSQEPTKLPPPPPSRSVEAPSKQPIPSPSLEAPSKLPPVPSPSLDAPSKQPVPSPSMAAPSKQPPAPSAEPTRLSTPSATRSSMPSRSAYPTPSSTRAPPSASSSKAPLSSATRTPAPSRVPVVIAAVNTTIKFPNVNTTTLVDRNFVCQMQYRMTNIVSGANATAKAGTNYTVAITGLVDPTAGVRYTYTAPVDATFCAAYAAPSTQPAPSRAPLPSPSSSPAAPAPPAARLRALAATTGCSAVSDPDVQCTPLTPAEQTQYSSSGSGAVVEMGITAQVEATTTTASSDSTTAASAPVVTVDVVGSSSALLTTLSQVTASVQTQVQAGSSSGNAQIASLLDDVSAQANVDLALITPQMTVSAAQVTVSTVAASTSEAPAAPAVGSGSSFPVLAVGIGAAVAALAVVAAVVVGVMMFNRRPAAPATTTKAVTVVVPAATAEANPSNSTFNPLFVSASPEVRVVRVGNAANADVGTMNPYAKQRTAMAPIRKGSRS